MVRIAALLALGAPSLAHAAAPEVVFYPPLGPAEVSITQPFDAAAEPVVQFLAMDADGYPTAVLASYSLTIGYGDDFLSLDAASSAFEVTVHAADLRGFDPTGTYALDVSSAGVSLGRVEVAFVTPTLMLVSGETTSRAVLDRDYAIPVAFHLGEGDGDYVDTCLRDGTCVTVGCDGVEGSGLVYDACGVCGGDGSSCIPDECGVLGGDGSTCGDGICLYLDECGVCDGDGSSCAGCDGVPNSGLVVGCDGICGGLQECSPPANVPVAEAAAVVGANITVVPLSAVGTLIRVHERLLELQETPRPEPAGRPGRGR